MKTVRAIGCLFAFAAALRAQFKAEYPPAPVRNVVDEYWGVKVSDPYRYMEKLQSPEVQKWIRAQADYAKGILARIPGRQALYERLKELDKGKPYRISSIRRQKDGSLFYTKLAMGDNISKLFWRSPSGKEKLLVDPEKMTDKSGKHSSLEVYTPSPDGSTVVYGVAKGGSEETILHVLDMKTGADRKDILTRIEAVYDAPAWLPDGSGFFYCRRQKLPPSAPPTEIYKNSNACFHKLGDDPAKDKVVFSRTVGPGVPMADTDFPAVNLTSGSNFAVGKIKHGDANEISLYAAPVVALLKGNIPWKKICDPEDEVTEYAVHGSDIYLLTAKGAPRYRIVRTNLAKPDFSTAETVLPQTESVVEDLAAAGDALYAAVLDGGFNRIARIEYGRKAKPKFLRIPGAAAAYINATAPELEGIFLSTTSWTKGGLLYNYDPKSGKCTDTGLVPKGKFDDVPGYESREVKVKSHDGELVPLSIVFKKGLKWDGSHPCLISGYGSYGIADKVYFNATRLAWLERGGVIAEAHVRGGGDYGKEWHLAGQKLNKPNTWKDFIACAEYLIEKGYTSKERIAGQGGSAGGILIGRAITERPDLFAAAIIHVGCLDAVRAETTTNGVPNIPEFGTVKEKDGFKGLLEMSAYHHVQDGVKYPAVLLTHGINDPRVDPWNSAKMTARLQAGSASGKPILFRVDYDAGHGIGSTRDQRLQQTADEWAFLLWQFGVPEYQIINRSAL